MSNNIKPLVALMSDTPKIRMTEAAKIVGVHLNTLRNWRKANKLKSAEKVFENGIEVWYVELAEVERLHRQTNTNLSDTQYQSVGSTNDNQAALPASQGQSQANATQLDIMRELLVTPLTELIKEQSLEIGNLREELGQMKERLRQLEASKPAPTGPNLTETAQKVQTTIQENNGPQSGSNELMPGLPTSNKQRRGSWWERLVGGG